MQTIDEHWPMSRTAMLLPAGGSLLLGSAAAWMVLAEPSPVMQALGWLLLLLFGSIAVLALSRLLAGGGVTLTPAAVVVRSTFGRAELPWHVIEDVQLLDVSGTPTMVLCVSEGRVGDLPGAYRWWSRVGQRFGFPAGVYLNHTSVADLGGLYGALRSRLGLPEAEEPQVVPPTQEQRAAAAAIIDTTSLRRTRLQESYRIPEVDAFLDRVMRATTVDARVVRQARFSPTRLSPGYRMEDVDDLLDRVAAALEAPPGRVAQRAP